MWLTHCAVNNTTKPQITQLDGARSINTIGIQLNNFIVPCMLICIGKITWHDIERLNGYSYMYHKLFISR